MSVFQCHISLIWMQMILLCQLCFVFLSYSFGFELSFTTSNLWHLILIKQQNSIRARIFLIFEGLDIRVLLLRSKSPS